MQISGKYGRTLVKIEWGLFYLCNFNCFQCSLKPICGCNQRSHESGSSLEINQQAMGRKLRCLNEVVYSGCLLY